MRKTIGLLVVLGATVCGSSKAEEPVNFPDPNLKAAVEQALGIPNPTPTDMLGLGSLDTGSSGITDLTGLEYAFYLTDLYVWHLQIADLEPLSGLMNLAHLLISGDQITDIQALSGLANLEQLFLNGDQIADLRPLSVLTTLKGLSLVGQQITDIQPLSGLTDLQSLWLFNTRISDIQALSCLTNLRLLGLESKQISNIAPLSTLANLQTLSLGLGNCKTSDIRQLLYSLTNLQGLWLLHCKITDTQILPLAVLTDLRYFGIQFDQLTDIQSLSALTNLETLQLERNQISNIAPLSALTSLRDLGLTDNRIADIEALADMEKLTYLDLRGNPLNLDAYSIYIPQILANNPGIELYYDLSWIWDAGGDGLLWRDPQNWYADALPTSSDAIVTIDIPDANCLIDPNTIAVGGTLYVSRSSKPCYLNMTGGQMNVYRLVEVGAEPTGNGVIYMQGGTMTLWGDSADLKIGNLGTGTLYMTGGIINVQDQIKLALGSPTQTTGVGRLYLYGGTLNAGNLWNPASGIYGDPLIDITQGTLTLRGDYRPVVNEYINRGWLIGYGGLGRVAVTYDSGANRTTVRAVMSDPNLAWGPNPPNGSTVPCMATGLILTWQPGATATWHDVYFARTPQLNERFSMGRQSTTEYDVGALMPETTYYWRIDEVEQNGVTIHQGDVWSFTTAPPPPVTDLNGDGTVELHDFSEFAESYASSVGTPEYDPKYDFDSDGTVSLYDLRALGQDWLWQSSSVE